MLAAGALFSTGFFINLVLLLNWFRGGMRLSTISYPALLGLLLIILGFQTFVFTLLFHMINGRHDRSSQ